MSAWSKWVSKYSAADDAAFRDKSRIDIHFGLPLPSPMRVFSLSLNGQGLSNVHEGGKQFRSHYFGNYLAYRYLTCHWPDAWIWDERYRFEPRADVSTDANICGAQAAFLEKLGIETATEIQRLALDAGLDPGRKTSGRPDLAVWLPREAHSWRFIEIKIPERNDTLGDKQTRWLHLLSNFLGRESVVELEFRRE